MQSRRFAPLGQFLLALIAVAGMAALSACSESDNRPLLVVQNPTATPAAAGNVGRVDVKVTTKEGTPVTKSFTPAQAASGSLGVYLPSGTSGLVLVVVTIYGTDGTVLAISPAVQVSVTPGRVTTTEVWSTVLADAGVPLDTEPAALDATADATLDATPPGLDVQTFPDGGTQPETGADKPIVVMLDASELADVAGPDAPPSLDTASDAAIDLSPTIPDALPDATPVDTTPTLPVWHAAENIEKDQINKSFYPEVAVDPINEHVYVAWVESTGTKVKRWNRTTETWEASKTLDSRGVIDTVHLGVDGKGNVIATWVQASGYSGSDPTIYGLWASSSADGVSWSPPYQITTGQVWDFQLAVARSGTARVVYSKRTTTNVDPLFHAYFDGLTWTDNATPIYDPQDSHDYSIRLLVTASGDGFVLFKKTSYEGMAISMLTGKTGASAPVILDNNTTNSIYESALVMNKKGTVVAVWSEGTGSGETLRSNTYTASSGCATTPTTIATVASASELVAVIDESDIMTLAWHQPITTGYYNTVTMRGKVDGAWGDLTPLETDSTAGGSGTIDESAPPQLAIDGSGTVLAVWRKEIDGKPQKPGTTFGLYASAYRGGAWLPPVQLMQRTGIATYYPSLSVSDNGLGAAAFYMWSDTVTDVDLYNTMVAFFR